jgi:small subunit ribosomal protein S13
MVLPRHHISNGLIAPSTKVEKVRIQMPEEFKHIVRIAGKDLSGERQIQLALSDLKGASVNYARAVAYVAKVNPFEKLGNLTKEQIELLEKILKNPSEHGIPSWMLNRRKDYETGKDLHLIGTDVTVSVRSDIGRERRIRSRRGIRHELGLPVRGQRTRTTGRKGLVVGVKRKEVRIREEAAKAEKGRAEKAEVRGGKEKPEAKEEKKEAKEEKKAETKETKETKE